MKNLLILTFVLFGTGLFSQKQNEKGLFVNKEGGLFNGTIISTQNNIRSEFIVAEGQINGEAKYFYPSGKLMEKGHFTRGEKDKKWTRYNENGSISAIAFYNLGKKTGTWLVFDDLGRKRFEMNYLDGEKVGTWTNWNEQGLVAESKDYGKLN